MELDRSSFEVYVDPSTGFRSIDDPSISLSDPSTRRTVMAIYTHVMCSLQCVSQLSLVESVFSVWSSAVTVSTEIQEKTLILACLLFLLFTLLTYKLRFAC